MSGTTSDASGAGSSRRGSINSSSRGSARAGGGSSIGTPSPVAYPPARLILASSSPRRQLILREAGYEFTVYPANINEESYPPALIPSEVAKHLAIAKAEAVSAKFPGEVVLAADTIVAFGDRVMSKPADAADARRMLELLSGTVHIVITGVAVHRKAVGFAKAARVMSAVRMRRLMSNEIDAYIQSGDWEGKAGGYGIQDVDPFVTRVTGSHRNIVGLPMTVTTQLLSEAGIPPPPNPRRP